MLPLKQFPIFDSKKSVAGWMTVHERAVGKRKEGRKDREDCPRLYLHLGTAADVGYHDS